MAGKPGRGPKEKPLGSGRQRGVPNRRTVEAALEAERAVTAARTSQGIKKLGKEILDDFANLFAGMAAYYQPAPDGMPARPNQNENKFDKYAVLAVKTAEKLAEFQSPKFRALMITPPPEDPTMPGSRPAELARPTGKTMGALEAYQLLRDKNDIIDIIPVPTRSNGGAATVSAVNGAVKPAKKANGHG
jgi:hypothetical protein